MKTFFSELRDSLRSIDPSILVEFLFVPGNHDCNLDGASEVRQILIANMPSQLSSLDPDGDLARQCLKVQDEFFTFEANLCTGTPLSTKKRLYHEKVLEVKDKRIKFKFYNTAWLAQRDNPALPLVYPLHVAEASNGTDADDDLVISLFHYPYTWLEPNNSREFKQHIDGTSDIILTGHEHVQRAYRKLYSTGEEVNYAEGAVLQETGKKDSGFNVLIVDVDGEAQRVFHFQWRDDIYAQQGDAKWQPFRRNKLIARLEFENKPEYARELSKIGAGFTHPRKKNLELRDLYVYPDCLEMALDKKLEGAKSSRLIRGEEIHDYLDKNQHVVMISPAEAGKSTLAKVLYRDLQKRCVIPMMMKGEEVTALTHDQFLKGMHRVFDSQYAPEVFEQYKQLNTRERALIIDDFDKSPLNTAGRNTFLRLASEWFDTVILFAGELFHLEVLTGTSEEPGSLRSFHHCVIRPFGWRLRGRLIEKWLLLGREFTSTEVELDNETRQFEKIISGIIGKNLLPAFPIVILSILQTIEASRNHNLGSGSLGYIYESLITGALAGVSQKPTDIEKTYAVLSHFAYDMFLKEKSGLSKNEIDLVAGEYFRMYGVNFNVDKLIEDLTTAHMLRFDEGLYRFEQNYCYYYFVARFFADHFSDAVKGPELHKQALEMVDTIHYEQYAQILIFLIYLTKDLEIIERIRENASHIYAERGPCDLDVDVSFVNQIYKATPQRELPASPPQDNRERHREQMDEVDEEEQSLQRLENLNQKVKYSEDLDELIKLNIAFKTMQLMGQVVRNFPYTLIAETKVQLVKENYRLGLRTLKAIFSISKDNLEECKQYYAKLIRERRALVSDAELDSATTALMIWLTLAVGYGIIKKVSQSIGAEELSQTFREVLETLDPQLAVRLIDVSIKLDHFSAVPVAEIEALTKDLQGNPYTYTLLRDLVLDYLYLFHCDMRIKQKLGALFNIKISDPRLIDNPLKQHTLTSSEAARSA